MSSPLEAVDRNVAMVTGLGCRAANFAPFVELSEMFGDDAAIQLVDGAQFVGDRLTVISPLAQAEMILGATSPEEKLLIISHSIGIAAGMECIEKRPPGQTQVIAIAPPLPTPATGVRQAVFLDRLKRLEGEFSFPSFSFATDGEQDLRKKGKATADVIISPAYFTEVDSLSEGFAEKVLEQTSKGRLQIVAANNDWNTVAFADAGRYENTLFIDAPHSLYLPQDELRVVCAAIYNHAMKHHAT